MFNNVRNKFRRMDNITPKSEHTSEAFLEQNEKCVNLAQIPRLQKYHCFGQVDLSLVGQELAQCPRLPI